MKDSFKININNNIYKTLKEDQQDFNIKNFNTIMNLIFKDYMLTREEEDICDMVWGRLRDKGFTMENVRVVDGVLKEVIYPQTNLNKNDNRAINIRLVGENVDYYEIMETDKSYSDSIFFRKMTEIYTKKPKFRRERILFSELIRKLESACESRKKLIIFTGEDEEKSEVYPHSIYSSKDESGNYLLLYNLEENRSYPIKIKSIKKCLVKTESYFPSKDLEKELERKRDKKILTKGRIEKSEILLTSEGYRLYKVLFNNRPEYESHKEIILEGKKYHHLLFYTTRNSLKFYFLKFGDKCKVIFPESMKDDFKEFYDRSFKSYKNIKNKDLLG